MMTNDLPTPKTITLIVHDRRFRSLLDRCDECAAEMTSKDLYGVAVAMGDRALDDNLVFCCASCFVKFQALGVELTDNLQDVVRAALTGNCDRPPIS